MSASHKTDLFERLADVQTDDADGWSFMTGLSEAGRLHRAAQALAEEAFVLGEYVDEQEAPEAIALMAAQDSPHTSTTQGARYISESKRLQVWLRPGAVGFDAIQEAGPGGVALETSTGLVPLKRDLPQPVPSLDELPQRIAAIDRRGRRVLLERMNPT
jgi:hypothetical protein